MADRCRRPDDRLRHARRVRPRARWENVAEHLRNPPPHEQHPCPLQPAAAGSRSSVPPASVNAKSRPRAAFLRKNRRRPTLPGGCPPSTIGAERLNCSVRNGKRCFPLAMRHRNFARRNARWSLKTAQDLRVIINPSSPRPISTGRLRTLLYFHRRPINLVVYQGSYSLKGDGRTYLEDGFPLRCFQRLSVPCVANLRCPWQDNRYTRGMFIPVLSY